MHNKTGGSTTNVDLGDVTQKDAYSVEVYPDLTMIIKGTKLVEQDIFDLQHKIREQGIELNVHYLAIGTWVNEETGNSEIGVSALIPDLSAALQLAEQYNQLAVWYHGGIGSLIYLQNVQPGGVQLPAVNERRGVIAAKSAVAKSPILKPRVSDPYSFNAGNLPPGKVEAVKIISDADIEASAERGKEWRDWYTTWDKYMRALVGKRPEYHALAAWFFAATSPSNLVGANIAAIQRAFRNFVETGDPGISFGKMESHQFNLRRVVGKFPTGAVAEPTAVGGGLIGGGTGLSGGKVPEFAPALLGDPHAIAVDMHVASILFGTKSPTEWQRFAGQMAILRISKRMGWSPAEVQAAIFADHIKQTEEKGVLARAEQYMEQYNESFLELIEADQEKGGEGAIIGRGILQRAGERIGPERFLRNADGVIAAIRKERVIAINPSLANAISLTGPKEKKAAAKSGTGRAQNGTLTTAADARIPNAASRLLHFYNGVKQVFWNSPGLSHLGDMVHKHTDLKRKYMGEYMFPFVKWARDFNMLNPARKRAINEHMAWREAKAGKQPLQPLSPEAKRLKDVFDGVIAKINKKNATLGIRVKHPSTGNWVPMPAIEYPAKIKEETLQAIRKKQFNHTVWRQLSDHLKGQGIVPKSATDEQVQNHLDDILREHRDNSVFGQFFFYPNTLPASAFDYSYEAMQSFINEWTEKVSLHEAFGPNTPTRNAFDVAANATRDPATSNYIKQVKRLAYGETVNDVWGRFAVSAGHMAALWHLANFASATKNLVSGMAFNAQSLGIWNFTKALFQVPPFYAINDAVERGILLQDMMNVMSDGEKLQGSAAGVVSQFAGAGLKASGFNAAETWVRGVAMRGAESMLRHAIKANDKNPRSGTSLRYRAYFQRLGVRNVEGLLSENGKGENTDEYLRAAVNEIQGGYTYADVPVYMESAAGRVLLKYRKWGSEQAKHFAREVLKPAARTVGLQPKEKVEVTDAAENKQMVDVPRSVWELMPLARYFVLIAAAGAGEEWLLEKMFGIHPKTVRLAEAMAAWRMRSYDEFSTFWGKFWQMHLLAGSMGAVGGYIQTGYDWATGKKRPGEGIAEAVPALDPFLTILDQFSIAYEQEGHYEGKDFHKFVQSISGVRVTEQAAKRVISDVFGVQSRYSEAIANRQDLALVKDIQRRYRKDKGVKEPKSLGYRPEKTEQSRWREPLDEALQVGDIDGAKKLVKDAQASMSPQRWQEVELKNLKSHIKAKQPIPGAANRAEVLSWMKDNKNLSPYEKETMRRLDETYRRTAARLPLGIEFKPPSLDEILKHRQQIALRGEATEYQPSE